MRLTVELPNVPPLKPNAPPPSPPPSRTATAAATTAANVQQPPDPELVDSVWDYNNLAKVLQTIKGSRSRMKMDHKTSELLAGRLSSQDIPSLRPRVVRLFLCSAGTDCCTERTVFMERVYPKLREYCRYRYALEFQVVDLCWGMSEIQEGVDPSLTSFTRQQILKCQKTSAGPSFVAFIGQKYGARPLHTSIVAEQYEVIRVALHAHRGRETRSAPLLDQCYVIDTNSVPAVYVLRSPADIMADLSQGKGQQTTEGQWQEVREELVSLLQKGAELAYLDGALDSDICSSFFMSDLEKEIQLGIENCDNPQKRCVLVLRDIVDLKNYLQHPQAASFTQLTLNPHTGQQEVDTDSENRLLRLKNRARGLISPANTLQHEVLWKFDDVIHPKLHNDYLQTLCDQLYEAVKRLVDLSAQEGLEAEQLPPMVMESLQHWSYCKRRHDAFFPCRPQVLQQLRDYVTGYSDRPLVLHGACGSGKTLLLSKLALELGEMVPGHLLSVIRYVGLTANSSDVRQLLLGVCRQLTLALGYLPDNVPTDFKDLQRFFPQLLQSVPADATVVIILDALDQLSPDNNAHHMTWLPTHLPVHVKIVVSTSESEAESVDGEQQEQEQQEQEVAGGAGAGGKQQVLRHLQEEVLQNSPSSFLRLQSLDLQQCQLLMHHFLALHQRQITEEQMQTFCERFQTCSLPLYVKLMAEEALTLKSFTDATSLQLPKDCTDSIHSLFHRLEAKHGRPVVGRAMAYLVASGTGLSDLEMEDLLSLDDQVLNHIFADQHPPLRRVPYAVWLKIRQEVDSFLTGQEVDGVTVTLWEHDAFPRAARARYLLEEDPAQLAQVHALLADYFLGTWARKAKPLQPLSGPSQLPAPCAGEQADRLVPCQPLTFPPTCGEEEEAVTKFNKRMLDHVPRHLVLSGRQAELNARVLFNYDWLYHKTRALSLQHCLADFALNPGPEASLVQEALKAAAPTIERDIRNLPAEVTGRLLPYYASRPSIRALIRSCDLEGLKHCALLPNFPYQQVPGSSLKFSLECPVAADFMGLAHGDRYLLCKRTQHSDVFVFDMLTGEHKDTIFASNGELHVTPNGRYFIIVDHVTEKSFKIHDSGSGAFLGQIILLNHMRLRTDRYRAGPLSLTDDRLCAVVETSDTSILFICEVPSGDMLQIIGLDGKATVCQITPDGQHVLCNSNEFLLIYQLYSLQHVCTVSVTHKPQALAFTLDGLRAFVAAPEDDQLLVLHLQSGQVEMSYKVPLADSLQGDAIKDLSVSPNDELVLIRSDQHLLVHQRAKERLLAHLTRPEQVPKEFRLPKSSYKEMVFTNALFTSDSRCVIATIFRNIYIWQISDSQLLTTIQAPMGVISTLLVCRHTGHLLTRSQGSGPVQVWDVQTVCSSHVGTLDKLTGAVQDVLVTRDNSVAFVQCRDSDEVGVFDMRSGTMLDLLTHDCKVQDLAITPSGHMALVCSDPRLSGTACKLWDLTERKVLQEWGDSSGHCLSMHAANSIVHLGQPQASLHAPYDISIIHFIGDTHTVHENPGAVKYVRGKPVVTFDDRFIVVSSALGYDDRAGQYLSPCLVVFDMTCGMKRTCYDAKSVGLEDLMEDMVSVQPCPREECCVAVVVSCHQSAEEADILLNRTGQRPSSSRNSGLLQEEKPQLHAGFFILDLRQGCITTMNFLQPAPGTPFPPRLIFSPDFNLCMDEESCLYNLLENTALAGHHLPHPGTPPQCFALDGSVVVYFRGSELYVLRVLDGRPLARCEVHAPVCLVAVCWDQRTLLVGCEDGTLASYVVVDPHSDPHPSQVVSAIKSRTAGDLSEEVDGRLSRSWDKVEVASAPPYSRPPSAVSPGSKDKLILRQIQPVPRFRPKSDTFLYLNKKSQACSVM